MYAECYYAECRYAEYHGACYKFGHTWSCSKGQTYVSIIGWVSLASLQQMRPGKSNRVERLSTVDLLIKVACFLKEVNNIFNKKVADPN